MTFIGECYFYFFSTEKHKPQVFRSILSLVILAKVCVEHNVWTMSGKEHQQIFLTFDEMDLHLLYIS